MSRLHTETHKLLGLFTLVSVRFSRMDMMVVLADDDLVSKTIEVGTVGSSAKRVHRAAEEKRRIVEATFLPGASIARVARENGVNANQVFHWRYEHRKGVGWASSQSRTELLPVTVTHERDR